VHAGSGTGTCYGKRDIRTSAAEGGCTTQHPFLTEMVCGTPWGKCTLLGDPHITPFDRKMLGSFPIASQKEDLHMVPVNLYDAGEFYAVSSTPLKIAVRLGYTSVFRSASSTVGVAATGPLLGGHTLAVAYVGPSQTPAYKGWKVTWDGDEILTQFPSAYLSDDNNINATFRDMEPTDFAVRARSTIGTAGGLHPSYVFELGPSRSVQIYVLPGEELSNVVISMKKVVGQDGLCGNFNCDWTDDSKKALRSRGALTQIRAAESLFPQSLSAPQNWDVRSGPSTDEIMGSCPPSVQIAAACEGTPAERESCLFDACVEAVAFGQMFDAKRATFLQGQPLTDSLKSKAGVIESFAFAGSVLGCGAVLSMWWQGRTGQLSLGRWVLPRPGEAQRGYASVASGERGEERRPLL